MKLTTYISIILLILFITTSNAQQKLVTNLEEFNTAIKNALPGTTIALKNGEWKDVALHVYGIGTEKAPITVTAETKGQVIITGNSKLTISGSFLVVSGLWFKDGTPTGKEVVSFRRNAKEFATNCRFTNNTISNYNPTDRSIINHWVDLWGKNNRVDYNNFTGKTNGGTTLVVWLNGDEHIENNHRIDHNYFGKRPELGVNGGETIRIGTSEYSMKSSKTIVEFNTFKHCNGEMEIISNKSNDNIFSNNIFIESEGTLTLRHGNNALVENNVFLGNNKPKTGGIRIINEGHIVRNNLLIGLTGDELRGPIVVMNGVPNSPLNRYNQVKDVDIQNNTIINCGPISFGTGKDAEKSLAPIRTVFANNLVANSNGTEILKLYDDASGISFFGNIAETEGTVNSSYFTKGLLEWLVVKGLPMPSSDNEILKSAKKTPKSPILDMANAERTTYVAGAFNLNNTVLPEIITTKTGPNWNPIITDPVVKVTQTIINVAPGAEAISKALKKATSGNTILLEPGIYHIDKTMKIEGNITIKGTGDPALTIIKSSTNVEKPLTYFFRVNPKGRFTLENVTLDGEASTYVKYAVVSPEDNVAGKYSVFINNSVFKNFKNKDGGAVYKAYVGTLADTISIKNSKIEDSFRGLNLSYQKDELGIYNAEVIHLYNSVFTNIEEFAVNYARNGVNPSNFGGQLIVNQCVFNKVANAEKLKMISVKGIRKVAITNSAFVNSINSKNCLTLSGFEQSISNCLVYDTGAIKASEGAQQKDVVYKSPKWDDSKNFIPAKGSPLLKEHNKIEQIGLIKPLKN